MKDDQNTHRYTLRLPTSLRNRIADDARRNGRTENAEIIARLHELPAIDLIRQLLEENLELKQMVRQLKLDQDS